MPDVLLIDTYSLFFRAFHALPRMNTTTGEPTQALYGFSMLLLKLLREHAPRGLSFALDAPQRTFRHERFDGYKGTRPRIPNDLALQLGRLDELLEAMGAPSLCVPGYEADDLIASLSRRLEGEGVPTLVVSGDRDLLQLASSSTRILFVGARGKKPQLYDVAAVRERFGVGPELLPSFTALVGDASDNLPGVPGIGPGTAKKLLQQWPGMAELTQNMASISNQRIAEALRGRTAQLLQVEELARLHTDVPLGPGPLFTLPDHAAWQRLRELFEALEFKSLLQRVEQLAERDVAPA
ncbi:MAG TPA: 5'-3' exonuclease H3TH domain-containing protein [Polyangiaceae bacterium]